jgi:GTP-binding protein EngB required for normal cell division
MGLECKKLWQMQYEKFVKIFDGIELPQALASIVENASKEICEFEMIIPVLGGFSAGKSSLINALLGENTLPVDITPVTAIAAEIRKGDSKVIAWKRSGETDEFKLNDIHAISSEKYNRIAVYTDSPFFVKYGDIVLVDMPGIDSNLDSHNRALHSYLPKAQAAIALTDIEHGSVKHSILLAMESFSYFGSRIAVLVSKADLKHLEDRTEVVQAIRRQMRDSTGEDFFVGCISADDGDLTDAYSALDLFSFNQRLGEVAGNALLSAADAAKKWLSRVAALTNADTKQIDSIIDDLESQKKAYKLARDEEAQALFRKFSENIPDQIINQVKDALEINISILSEAAKAKSDVFARTVSDVVRNELLIAIRQHAGEALQESTDIIASKINNSLDCTALDTKGFCDSTFDVSTFFKQLSKASSGINIFPVNYLAVILAVFEPLALVAVALFPLISRFFSESREDSINKKIRETIFPQIISKLRPEIVAQLKLIVTKYLEELDNSVQEKNALVEASLESHKLQKITTIKEAEEAKKEMECRIECVSKFIDEVKRMISSYSTKNH